MAAILNKTAQVTGSINVRFGDQDVPIVKFAVQDPQARNP
jgi:hypothetical protein